MKPNKSIYLRVLAVLIAVVAAANMPQLLEAANPPDTGSGATQWSVQVAKVDPGEVKIEPSFTMAIYENLLREVAKTNRFKQVIRDGDRNAKDIPNLLILKTKVEKYSAGSETRRAVTTVTGATKLSVRSQLCTRDGKVVLEQMTDGKVLFFGANLRATQNLAHNVAKKIKKAVLPQVSLTDRNATSRSPDHKSAADIGG